jgi:hypothetical protein
MTTVPFPQSVAQPRPLPEDLRHKALAVKLQLDGWDRELALAQVSARNALLEKDALQRQLGPLEAQLLAAMGAPAGATFNWQTLTADAPPEVEASRPAESPP